MVRPLSSSSAESAFRAPGLDRSHISVAVVPGQCQGIIPQLELTVVLGERWPPPPALHPTSETLRGLRTEPRSARTPSQLSRGASASPSPPTASVFSVAITD